MLFCLVCMSVYQFDINFNIIHAISYNLEPSEIETSYLAYILN